MSLLYFNCIRISIFSYSIFFLLSCQSEVILPSSNGSINDLLVVCDTNIWNGRIGGLFKKKFTSPQEGLPQQEPIFDLIHLKSRSFNQLFKRYRNIILIDIDDKNTDKIQFLNDKWSKNQYLVVLYAKNNESLVSLIKNYGDKIVLSIKRKESERIIKGNKKEVGNNKNIEVLKRKMGVKLQIDPLFTLADSSNRYMWFSKEKKAGEHIIYQGIMIYILPYSLFLDTSKILNFMVNKRDSITGQSIKGAVLGAYMKVYKEYEPDLKSLKINKYKVIEIRGLWHMSKGFMGGPFLNYSFFDKKNKRIICLDAYVYAPKFDKRDILFELESILKTAEIY